MVPICLPSLAACRARVLSQPRVFYRQKSLFAAIERGSQHSRARPPRTRDAFGSAQRSPPRERSSSDRGGRQESKYERRQSGSENRTEYRDRGNTRNDAGRDSEGFRPESLPFTTAASEFLYGYSVVLAAITAGRRKLYNLYLHERGLHHENIKFLLSRARIHGIKIHEVGDNYLPLMDKASSGRPHNGFVLEASPLPRSPIVKLEASMSKAGTFQVQLDSQSTEDRLVNGTQTQYTCKSGGWKFPFVLYVDGVLDEGNLGAIARSAYFLGVDAIATPVRQSAPWSHITLKASAGAAEAIPIFTVARPAEFLTQSAREGWRVYASDAVRPEGRQSDLSSSTTNMEKSVDDSSNVVFTYARSPKRVPSPHHPVATHPTILMMGAEGAGLRSSLINHAHYKVGIVAGRQDEIGVDSLNVSVAASLLCFEFLKKPPSQPRKSGELLF